MQFLSVFSPSYAMDIVLHYTDYYFFTPYVYPSSWPEDGALRQILSLLVVTNLGAAVIYLLFGMISYYFIFDHTLKKHPQYLPNQVQREIKYALNSMPWMSIPTVALFFAEVRGYSKLYDNIEDSSYGWYGVILSMISFLFFTDMCIYWIHRFLHHRLVYRVSIYTSLTTFGRLQPRLQVTPFILWMVFYRASRITSILSFSRCTSWSTWASTSLSTSGQCPFMTETTECLRSLRRSSTVQLTTLTTTCTLTITMDSTSHCGTESEAPTCAPHPSKVKDRTTT
ncbi:lathosterol oxidase isoform X4 [Heterodontus francisci]|uniref:lathosterol oxidase isoform X4 n=1 Tax=Heterodontus francisci TaxID=7792 RepID=UPI00355B3396